MSVATSLVGSGRQNAYDTVAASSTDSPLVTGGEGQRIRVVAFMVNHGDTTPSAVTFNSKGASSGTAVFPALKYAANGGTTTPECRTGWFETIEGEDLTVSTGAGSATGIAVVYERIYK